MRPASPIHTTAGIRKWNSPMPYLFGGLALMLGLITVALIILACSHKKSSSNSISNSSSGDNEQKPTKPPVHVLQPEMEPKIVVIMPGEENPSYLAMPVSANISHTEEV